MTDENIFDKYLEKDKKGGAGFFKNSRSWVIIFTSFVAIVLAVLFYKLVIIDAMSSEEIKKSIEITWIDSNWVDKKGTIVDIKIVPVVYIKIKNTGKRPLHLLDINAVFEFEESGAVFDDGMVRVFQEPLQPGQTSDKIAIKASFGYAAKAKASFMQNKEKWKKMRVKLFARTKGSGLVRIGDIYSIKQDIEGYVDGATSPIEEKKDYQDEKTRELAYSLQVVKQDSLWVDKIVMAKEVVIVPSITVQVKNVGKKSLQNLYFKGDFRFENTGEGLSEGITPGLPKTLEPGATSDPIEIKADFGYSAPSNDAFIKSTPKWKLMKVHVFVKTKETEYALLGTYSIKSKIQIYE
jgi:hypothetical protein